MSTWILGSTYSTRAANKNGEECFSTESTWDPELADEASFTRLVVQERKRTERSGKPFLLMLLESGAALRRLNGGRQVLRRLVSTLKSSTRDTDSIGWYDEIGVIGVIFTEVGTADQKTQTAILSKITRALQEEAALGDVQALKISLHRYPNDRQPPQSADQQGFYPDLQKQDSTSKVGQIVKRTMDIVSSALGLVFLAPVFLLVALAIKLNSKGPVLFKQTRVGQRGIPFTFLKFRSMRVNNDHRIHKEYVSRFISGDNGLKHSSKGNAGGIYKLTSDPRVTRVGRFLRKTSLDELPQLFNVLKGEMSLVGPRPPLLYEFERYDTWHRRRVLEAKPGITGLWQVNGRSRTSFDDMVRLDLRYASRWSLWLDLKILMQTPGAVFSGDGAY